MGRLREGPMTNAQGSRKDQISNSNRGRPLWVIGISLSLGHWSLEIGNRLLRLARHRHWYKIFELRLLNDRQSHINYL